MQDFRKVHMESLFNALMEDIDIAFACESCGEKSLEALLGSRNCPHCGQAGQEFNWFAACIEEHLARWQCHLSQLDL